jgi:hypothetical protein
MSEKRRIIWEKWENPSVFPIKDFKAMMSFLSEGDTFRDNQGNLQLINQSYDIEDPDVEPKMMVAHGSPIPFNPKTDIGKSFQIWIGHTNFNLNADITNALNRFTGVEILRILTRYRFLIGFGKAFLSSPDHDEDSKNPDSTFDPTRKIREDINKFFESTKIEEEIYASSIVSENQPITIKSKYWAEYILPNGKKKVVVSEEDTPEFQHYMEVLKESQQNVGGSLTSYLD